MKQITLNRKLKFLLSAHFQKGGTAENAPGELARVPLASRQAAFRMFKEGVARRKKFEKEAKEKGVVEEDFLP